MSRLKIESRDNARLKLARKIRDGNAAEFVFVEGLRLAEEAVDSNIPIEYCVVRSGFGTDAREVALLNLLDQVNTEILEVDAPLFDRVAETRSSQGIILICRRAGSDRMSFENGLRCAESKLSIVVMLHEVNNSSNLGAVIRTAEAAGAKGAVISERSADPFSPRSLRASMGSSFRLPMWTEANVYDAIDWANGIGHIVTAAVGNGTSSYTEVDWTRPRLLIFGSEAHGLATEVLQNVDETVRITMDSNVESLNLAVAAGVILFEARRQNSQA